MTRGEVADERDERGANSRGRRSWRSRTGAGAVVAGLAIGIVIVMLFSGSLNALTESKGAQSASGACNNSTTARTSPGDAAESYGAVQVAAAEKSLQTGAGPAKYGLTADISGNGSGAAGTNGACASSPSNAPLTTTSPSWKQVTYPTPAGSDFGSMVYDAKDNYVLLFGGYSSSVIDGTNSATWKFSNGVWTELHPTTSPTPREEAAIAYDAADHYVLLFGGYNETVGTLADTWKFAGGAWTQLTLATHPAALSTATMSYDTKDGYVVLFDSTPSTWKFVGGVWTKLSPATQPAGRDFGMMDYDAQDGYVLLFGGYNGTSGLLGDTWTFTGGDWTKLSPTTSPSARYGAAMAYSAINNEVVLFGGHLGSGMISDTWKFVGGVWTKISTEAHASDQSYAAAADGTTSTGLVVFGGVNASGAYLSDTWTFQGLVWTHVLPRTPAARFGDAMAYDQKDGYVVMFGGASLGIALGDTWTFSNGVWTSLNPAVAPPPRYYASMTYDAADGYVVLFGGENAQGTAPLGDTWTFVGGVWTNVTLLSSGYSPGPRVSAAMTYDYADGYVLLFGGQNGFPGSYNGILGDTWSFSAGYWTQVLPTVSPSARFAAQETYDSEGGYVLLFGGEYDNGNPYYADTWSYSGGTWTDLTSALSSSPPGTAYGGLVDDTYDGYPLLFGGNTFTGSVSTSWEFTGSAWTQLSPAAHPGSALMEVTMIYDPVGNYALMFGGLGDAWTY